MPVLIRHLLLVWFSGAFVATAVRSDLGPLYENKAVGFTIKPLKDWNAVPPKPDEKYQVVGWVSKREQLARKQHIKYNPEMNILVFRAADAAAASEDPKQEELDRRLAKYGTAHSFKEYAENHLEERGVKKEGEPKKKEINGVTATIWTMMFNDGRQPPVRHVAFVFPGDKLEVAVYFTSMDEWFSNISGDFDAAAKTFKFVETAAKPAAGGADAHPATKPTDANPAPGTTTDQDSP